MITNHPIGMTQSVQAPSLLKSQTSLSAESVEEAKEVKKVYSQFVGENFYGMMLKSMRKTVGKPAYFHGGQAEEMFRARLDQQIAQDLASSPSNNISDALFEHQFPRHAETLRQAEQALELQSEESPLAQLDALKKRA